ncbi:MAG: hypothetical protein OHK0011_12530 [Turneriella sp.]
MRLALVSAVCFGILPGCTPGNAQAAAYRPAFSAGAAVQYDFRIRDFNFSRLGQLDTSLLTAETDITAIGVSSARLFIGTSNRGIFESEDAGKTWVHHNAHEIPMALDPANQRRIYAVDNTLEFATHKHDLLYRTDDAQQRWQTVRTNLKRSVIFTALHRGKDKLYLGTSVNGLHVALLNDAALRAAQKPGGRLVLKFSSLNAGLPGKAHDRSHFIYEEVQAVHETGEGHLLIATGPRPAVYIKDRNSARFRPLETDALSAQMDECFSISSAGAAKVVLSCRRGIWQGPVSGGGWSFTPQSSVISDISGYAAYALTDTEGNRLVFTAPKQRLTPEKKARMQNASGHRLFYSSALNWQKRQPTVLGELSQDFWTGLVIDGKDDNGIIRYDSDVPVALSIGAVRPLYKMRDVVEKVHALGKRVVVRLVVFKDPKLFEREGYAIRDVGGGKWIGSPKERWIDPYNPNLLTDYYVPLVRELTERGVDEIQLDYIRFPSDGAIGRCRYSHKKSDHYVSEALENFLVGIRQATHLPLGADIYGYNGMYRVPGAIGQDLEVYGRILDVISPMHYSSHFGDDFMREYPRDDRAYQLLLLALSRGSFYAQGNFILRPYVQAFPMKNGLWGYGKKYFADQIRGSADGGGSGFMFWGQMDHMILVRRTQTG